MWSAKQQIKCITCIETKETKHLVGDGQRKRNPPRTPQLYMCKNNSMQIYWGLINQKTALKELTCEQKKDATILSNYTCVDAF